MQRLESVMDMQTDGLTGWIWLVRLPWLSMTVIAEHCTELLLVVRGVWALCEGLDGKLRAAASPVAITLDTALCV